MRGSYLVIYDCSEPLFGFLNENKEIPPRMFSKPNKYYRNGVPDRPKMLG